MAKSKKRNRKGVDANNSARAWYYSMENNNNKRKNDGRTYNKRKGRTKMIAKPNNLPAPQPTKAKKDRAKLLSKTAIKRIFGSEDGIWDTLAEQAQSGNMRAMEMLMQYQYGKAGDASKTHQPATKAPVIQFNVTPTTQEKTIDIEHNEEEE